MNDLSYKAYSQYSPIVELIRERAVRHPNRLAFTFLEEGEMEAACLTYEALDLEAKTIASYLQHECAPMIERALLLYPQGLEFITSFFGCLYAGIIAVPVNFLDPTRFVRNILRFQTIVEDAQANIVLTTSELMQNVRDVFEITPDLKSLKWVATDKINQGKEWRPVGINLESVAFLQYTSGSTSVPKGIMISHHNLLDNCYLFQQTAGNTPDGCMVNWVPHFHDMGLIMCIVQTVFAGMHCVHMSPLAFIQRPYRWLKAISDYGGTISCAPNFAYELCMTKIGRNQLSTLDLSSWEVALNAAEPIFYDTMKRFTEMFSPCGFKYNAFFPAWGLAEATVLITTSSRMKGPIVQKVDKDSLYSGKVVPVPADAKEGQYVVGCGRPLSGQKVIIVNPNSRKLCGPDKVGEIWAQCGDSMPQGYWNRPEATEETYGGYLVDTGEGPFLKTGDLGFIKDGEIFFTSRMKDLIIIRGANHYPQDIELTVQRSHPDLRPGNGAAFSFQVGKEERLVIVSELRKDCPDIDTKEIIRNIRQEVSEEHDVRPYAIVLIKAGTILKTSSGKTQRQSCKASFLEGKLKVVDEWHMPEMDMGERQAKEPDREKKLTIQDIQGWLSERLSQQLGLKPEAIDIRQPLARYGLDSAMAVGLSGDLASWLNRSLPPAIVYDYPTISSLSAYLVGKASTTSRISVEGRSKPSQVGTANDESIAVIGMACRLPGAEDPQTFWELLRSGRDFIREVPAERWDVEAY
ncbi:MAG: AMP-binding protein, partial [Proteobacteria bacterium]|nr:AMP-binding protein [Pseudomonadota bacterium]